MESNEKKEGFSYTYSAKDRSELERIRSKYEKKEETALERVRRLDASATKSATVISLILGVIGTLVMGTGMCCCILWAEKWFFVGIVVGFFGILLVAIAYPVYDAIVKSKRKKLAPEIIRLTDELMK